MSKIREHWAKEIECNLKSMSTARFSGPNKTKLDKKLSKNIKGISSKHDQWAIKHMLTIMCDGLETQVQLKHRGKTDCDKCKLCGQRDTTEHSLFCSKKLPNQYFIKAEQTFNKLIFNFTKNLMSDFSCL